MRLRSPSYRFLFYVMTGLAVGTAITSVLYYRRMDAAEQEAARRNEMNPVAISLFKLRDREYTFTVENYGFVYKGQTGNLIDDSVLTFGTWEKFMLFFFEDYVAAIGGKDTAFIDVGANTGTHSLFMATRVKEVHAFEPYPPILKRFHENIALNKFTNIRVHEVGLGDREATLPFFAPPDVNQGGGSFRPDGEKKPEGELRIVAGDEYLKGVKLAPVSIIKIDIEGFEEPALKGLRQTITQHRPLLMIEVTTPPGGTISSFAQLQGLVPENYEFFILAENNRQYLNGRYELSEFGPVADQFFKNEKHRNLVAVPSEKAAAMPRRRPGT